MSVRSLVLGCLSLLAIGCTGSDGPTIDTTDEDGDGFFVADDCNDADATSYPGAVELCDGLDNDCDEEIDEASPDAITGFRDSDGDGVGDDAVTEVACQLSEGFVAAGGDCDDADAAVFPAADEICDGLDNDCDAEVDEDAVDMLVFHADADADGFGDAADILACTVPAGAVVDGTDCDDADPAVYPAAVEVCGDGIDADCDGDDIGCCDGFVDDADVFTDLTAILAPSKTGTLVEYTPTANGTLTLCADTYTLSISGDGTDITVNGAGEDQTFVTSDSNYGVVMFNGAVTARDITFEGMAVAAAAVCGDVLVERCTGLDNRDVSFAAVGGPACDRPLAQLIDVTTVDAVIGLGVGNADAIIDGATVIGADMGLYSVDNGFLEMSDSVVDAAGAVDSAAFGIAAASTIVLTDSEITGFAHSSGTLGAIDAGSTLESINTVWSDNSPNEVTTVAGDVPVPGTDFVCTDTGCAIP